MDTFKEYFLTEATTASTYFEGVLVDCWNLGKFSKDTFYKKILTSPATAAFLGLKASGWGTTGKTPVQQKQILWHLSRLMKQKIKLKGTASSAGQSKPGVSTFWTQGKPGGYGGTGKGKDTSKADILIGKERVSVKGPSAQLMSGEQKEARATIISAFDYTGGNKKVRENLLKEVDGFITSTRTIGAEYEARVVRKASEEELKATGNWAARQILDQQKESKKITDEIFKKAFNKPKVGHAFAWEAMTGWEKFGGKTYGDAGSGREGEANSMLVWDYDMKKLIYHHITPSAPYVAKIAKEMKMAADMKSSRYEIKKVKAGYSFYQTVRLTYDTVFKKTDELKEDYDDAVSRQHTLLAEGKINEVKLKAALENMKNWFMSKVRKLWDWATSMLDRLKKRVTKILQQSTDVIMNFFDVEVNVKVRTTVKLI